MQGDQRFCPDCTRVEAAAARAAARAASGKKASSEEIFIQFTVIFGCGLKLKEIGFAVAQLLKKQKRLCNTCVAGNTMLACGQCKSSYPLRLYATAQLRKGEARQCKDCKQCGKCQRHMPSMMYSECEEHTPGYMTVFRKRHCNEGLEEAEEKLREQRKRDPEKCDFPVQPPTKKQA